MTPLSRREAFAAAAAVLAAPPPFRVGTFSIDVTPPVGHPCMGGGIAPVKLVEDPLFAKGFVLLGAGKPVVVVAVDWCELRNGAYDRWRDAIAAAVGTDAVRVMASCLHQHDAPIADLEAQELLEKHAAGAAVCDRAFHETTVKRVAAAAKACVISAKPVTHVGTGSADVVGVASNRRYLGPDGKPRFDRGSATRDATIRGTAGGTIDPVLRTLSLWDGDTPVVAVSAYSTHPMSYYGRGGVSADFVGLARSRRQADTPNVHQMYVSGCSGNTTAGKFNDGADANRRLLADKLHAAMTAAWTATKRTPIVECEFRSAALKLEPRDSAGFGEAELLQRLATDPKPFGRCLAALGLSWRRRCLAGRPIDVPVLDFGSAAYTVLPAEAYVEFQLAAQQARPGGFVVAAGYGECGPGYIPVEQAWAEGDTNLSDWCWVKPGSEKRFRDAIAAALKR